MGNENAAKSEDAKDTENNGDSDAETAESADSEPQRLQPIRHELTEEEKREAEEIRNSTELNYGDPGAAQEDGEDEEADVPDDEPAADQEEATPKEDKKEGKQQDKPKAEEQKPASKVPNNNMTVLYIDDASCKAGDSSVKVKVKVARNPGILGMSFAIRFDEGRLTLKKASNGSALKDVLDLTKSKTLGDGCRFAWDGVELDASQVQDGDVLTLTFDASNAAPGDYPISIEYEYGDVLNNSLIPIDVYVVDGVISVK